VKHAFRRVRASTLVGAFTLTMAAVPISAAERPPGVLASAQAHVHRIATSTVAANSSSNQPGVSGADDPGSFFRSRRGIAVLVLAAAGIGYVWYSVFHDRLGSPARDRLDN
jgi:hypothetical protein